MAYSLRGRPRPFFLVATGSGGLGASSSLSVVIFPMSASSVVAELNEGLVDGSSRSSFIGGRLRWRVDPDPDEEGDTRCGGGAEVRFRELVPVCSS